MRDMTVHLETERLVLREFTADDVDLLVELDSDPEVVFFITGGEATTRAEIEDHVLPHWLGLYEKAPGTGFWAAEEKASGDFIGWFHLRPGDGHAMDEPELGYRLRRTAWGKGYATEGSQALIDKAFAEHGARRILAETMVVNSRSRRVMENCGMRLGRHFYADWPVRIPGDEHGDVEYVLDRADWERRSRAVSS